MGAGALDRGGDGDGDAGAGPPPQAPSTSPAPSTQASEPERGEEKSVDKNMGAIR
jgi:hypothetical protein